MLAMQDICDRPGLLDADHALRQVLSYVTPIHGTDGVALREAAGRVTVEIQRSAIPLPPFDQSAVDGYAVLEHDLGTSHRSLTCIGRVAAGAAASGFLKPGET